MTDLGIEHVHDWGHNDLAHDLAVHLRSGGGRMVWVDIPMGPAGSPRPDVYAIKPQSFANAQIMAYEVKISVADLRSDLTSGKWQKYLAFSEGVTFAVPQGLCGPSDIPKECGLMIRGERQWRTLRKARLSTCDLGRSVCLKLLSAPMFRGRPPDPMLYRNDEYARQDWRRVGMRKAGERLGRDLAVYLRNPEAAERVIEHANKRAARIVADAEAQRDSIAKSVRCLLDALGVDPDARDWASNLKIRERAELLAGGDLAEVVRHARVARDHIDKIAFLADLAGKPDRDEGATS